MCAWQAQFPPLLSNYRPGGYIDSYQTDCLQFVAVLVPRRYTL